MFTYGDTQTRIIFWTLLGVAFLLFIALLSCFCSRSRRSRYEVIPNFSVNSIMQTHYDSFRQFQDYVMDFGEIEIGNQLGRGSYGKVYRGRFRGSIVAVKKMESSLHLEAGSETFITEVRTLSRLRNRNIVQFIGFCIDNDTPCIVMEYMKGGSVAKVIHEEMKELTPKILLKWALDAAIGMEFLHSHKPQPIIHRDLKSDNLLVDENGVVKVGDFGTAKLIGKIAKVRRRFSRKKQKRPKSPEDFPGTVAWAAPEVVPPRPPAKAGEYTTAADVYSFGITLWEMVARRRPFKGYKFEFQIMDDIIAGVRPPIQSSYPRDITKLIEECWHPEPTSRPTFPVIHKFLDGVKKKQDISELAGKKGGSLPTGL